MYFIIHTAAGMANQAFILGYVTLDLATAHLVPGLSKRDENDCE